MDEPFYLIHSAAAFSYYIQNKYEEALRHFNAALGRKGALPNELADLQFLAACCKYSLGAGQETKAADLQETIGLFEKAARVYEKVDQKKWVMTQYNLAVVYAGLPTGDRTASTQKTIAEYDKVIRLDPKFAKAYINRGNAYQKNDDYDKAFADYDEAIRLDPKDALAYNNRGRAYESKGDYEKAIADYDEAIRLDPKDAPAYNNHGNAHLAKGDYDKATVDYDEAIRVDPKFAFAYDHRGIAYAAKGDRDKAIADYDEAIRLNPKSALAYYNRGITHDTKGDHDKAIADFDEAIRVNPKFAFAYINPGIAYEANGDYNKAIADYDEAIRLNPKGAGAYNELAWLLGTCIQASFRNGKRAVEYATKACELSEWKDPNMIDTLAAAYAEAGDFKQAIKWETRYLETPNLSEKDATDAKSRLALYQTRQPYHAEK